MNIDNLSGTAKLSIHEAVGQNWYHGTPDVRSFSGTFEQRKTTVIIVSDMVGLERATEKLKRTKPDSPEYFSVLKQIGNYRERVSIPAPLFFTDNPSTARTYADDNRTSDYQHAEPAIISVSLPGPDFVINAGGREFSNIPLSNVMTGLKASGLDDDKADTLITLLKVSRGRNDFNILTDDLAIISYFTGYSNMRVVNVKDDYNGSSRGRQSTDAIITDPSLAKVNFINMI